MDRRSTERLSAANSERFLKRLTAFQHLQPASTLRDAVEKVCADEGLSDLSPDVVANLSNDEATRIGRLGRAEIRALAQQIESQWQTKMFEAAGGHPGHEV